MQCLVHDLGLIDYQVAWDLQNRLALEIARGERGHSLLLLEHPHTYTFGRRGNIKNLLWDEKKCAEMAVAVHWVDRGGDVTYHGPGQLVGYPLLRLSGQDHVGYIRSLEKMLILALARLGVAAYQLTGRTGVWVDPALCLTQEFQPSPGKIAAIGVKVDAQGVTRHGFALNVNPRMEYFDGIVPCGIVDYPVLALENILPLVPAMEVVRSEVVKAFGETFNYDMVTGWSK